MPASRELSDVLRIKNSWLPLANLDVTAMSLSWLDPWCLIALFVCGSELSTLESSPNQWVGEVYEEPMML